MIRYARLDELQAIRAVEMSAEKALVEAGIEFPENSEELYSDLEYSDAIRNKYLRVAQAEDGSVLGFYFWKVVDGDAYLAEIDVRQESQGQGAGSDLLEDFCEVVERDGFRKAWLTTFRDLPFNAPWYARSGFEVVGVEECGPEMKAVWQHEVDCNTLVAPRVIMCKRLKGVDDSSLGDSSSL